MWVQLPRGGDETLVVIADTYVGQSANSYDSVFTSIQNKQTLSYPSLQLTLTDKQGHVHKAIRLSPPTTE